MGTWRTAVANPFLAAVLAVLATAAFGVGGTWLCVEVAGDYGYAVFLALPFVLGFVAAALCGLEGPRSYLICLGATGTAFALVIAGLLVFGIEGLICLAMAAPIWLTLGVLGSVAGWGMQRAYWGNHPEAWRWRGRGFPILPLLIVVAFVPLSLGAERMANVVPPVIAVTTEMEIAAPPEVVWEYVVAQPDLPPPTEWLFRAGVAYPVRTTIGGTGVGAPRACVLSTGAVEETVRVWEPGRELAFDVQKTPASMHEMSFYQDLHPRHLTGYMISLRGQFVLTPLAGGRTLVTGTSWYQNHMTPTWYWRLWSDYTVHAIHRRVLGHIRNLAEADVIAGRMGWK